MCKLNVSAKQTLLVETKTRRLAKPTEAKRCSGNYHFTIALHFFIKLAMQFPEIASL